MTEGAYQPVHVEIAPRSARCVVTFSGRESQGRGDSFYLTGPNAAELAAGLLGWLRANRPTVFQAVIMGLMEAPDNGQP